MTTKPTVNIPEWATNAGAIKVEPSSGKKATGWEYLPATTKGERPVMDYWNWNGYSVGVWITYLDAAIEQSKPVVGFFQGYTGDDLIGGILGQQAPSSSTETSLYECPAGKHCTATVFISNTATATGDSVCKVFKMERGETIPTATKELVFVYALSQNETLETPAYCLKAGETLVCESDTGTAAFNANGICQSARDSGFGILAQVVPTLATETELYTCAASKEASLCVHVANNSGSASTIKIFLLASGRSTPTQTKEQIIQLELEDKDTFTSQRIQLKSGEGIYIESSQSNVSFNADGQERG
jgi:hypothetical protein